MIDTQALLDGRDLGANLLAALLTGGAMAALLQYFAVRRLGQLSLIGRPPAGGMAAAGIIMLVVLGAGGAFTHAGAAFGVLAAALAVVSWTDARYGLIPNDVVLASLLVLLLVGLGDGRVIDALMGAIGVPVVYLSWSALNAAVFRKPGAGGGDIKLASVIGAALGFGDGLLALGVTVVAVGLWLLMARRRMYTVIRFAPYLAAGTVVVALTRSYLEPLLARWVLG